MVRKLVYAVAAFAVIGGGIYALGTTTVRDVLDAKLRADCAGQDRAGNCVKRMLAMGHVRSRAGEMDSAKYWYAAAAEQGDTAAMFHLAWVHDQADLKDVKAQEIGWVPRFGAVAPATPEFFIEQIAKDRAESAGGVGKRHIDLAKRWYQAAANRGFAPAMNNLGAIYASGRGNRPEKSRAFVMFMAAARAGNPVAGWNLAIAYTTGLGVTANAAQAEKWET